MPSRLERVQLAGTERFFFEQAVASIKSQTILSSHDFKIIVGVDAGAIIPQELVRSLGIEVAVGEHRSQAGALNAAAKKIEGDYVAVLEDDDEWQPRFLECAFAALGEVDFVSSTTLEIDTNGEVLRVFDYPAPSGWVMKRNTWDSIGDFNLKFRWHLDNEWLGRLNGTNFKRIHLVEATAPVVIEQAALARPWLANVLRHGQTRLKRHASPWPLVKRLVHPGGGKQQIARSPALTIESRNEYVALEARFGCIPW